MPKVQKKHIQHKGILSLRLTDACISQVRQIAIEQGGAERIIIDKPSEGFMIEDLLSDMHIYTRDPESMAACLMENGVMFIAPLIIESSNSDKHNLAIHH